MKRLISLIVVIALAIGCLPIMNAMAAGSTVVYDGNTMAPFAGRTKEEIALRYCDARYASDDYLNGTSASYYSRMPSFNAPYDQGALRKGTTDVMNAMTNYYRWLVGVQPMTKLTESNDSLQKGAFVRNWQFSHAVNSAFKPADMDQALWDAGANVSHNILAMGYTPSGSIAGWLNEGYSRSTSQWGTMGHRTTILNASYSGISYGYSGNIAIGVTTGITNTWGSNAFAAYPAPGYMPCNEIRPLTSAWSVELNPAVLSCTDASKVTVTVTDLRTNKSYVCTNANGMGQFSKSALNFVQPEASGTSYADGDSFHVEITGLTDVKSGNAAKLVYTVNFFNVKDYGHSYATKYSINNGWSLLHLTQSAATEQTLAMIASILPDEVVVTTELGSTATVPVGGTWKLDTANQCWTNTVNEKDLPKNVTDPNGVLSEVRISYQIDSYTGSFSLGITSARAGDSSTISMWRYMVSTDTAQLFRICGNDADGYTAELMADNHSESFAENASGYWTWEKTWQMEDSGTWLGLYSSGIFQEAYIAGICELTMLCPHTDTYQETKPATCTESGSEQTICRDCGEVVSSKEIPALGCAVSVWTVSAVPTETQAGAICGTCTRCGESHTVTLPVLDEYNYTFTEKKPVTCTEDGVICFTWNNTAYGTIRFDMTVEAIGHYYTELIYLADCTHDGSITHTCLFCGDSYTEVIEAYGHDMTQTVVPPTCTEPGYILDVCSRCGKGTRADTAPALGHDFVDGICTRCGAAFDPCEGYTDIDRSKWYHEAADFVIERGLMQSTQTDALTFEPNTPCTRAMIVMILYNIAGNPDVSYVAKFPDVPDGKWYTSAVMWAYRNGIVNGYGNGSFGPNDKVTREQMAVILKGYADSLGKDTSKQADLSKFPDGGKATWSKDYLCWAVAEGLINGKAQDGQTYLDPQGLASRAEVAALIRSFVLNILDA